MKVTCLSVPNPRSYLLCAGIADIENKQFGTDYRGTVFIHSTGRYAIRGMPELAEYPVPVIHEFNDYLSRIGDLERAGRYIGFVEGGVRVFLKNEDKQSAQAVAEYALLSEVYAAYHKNPEEPFFHTRAIIGRAELVDVRDTSNSRWAQAGYKHWVFAKPVLYAKPVLGVSTARTGLWEYDTGG